MTGKRERRSREEPYGTVLEAGREKKFVSSPSGTVHERDELDGQEGYELDPKCGQTLSGSSLWAGIDAVNPEEVARKYGKTSFCSKCFRRAYKLERIGREARR